MLEWMQKHKKYLVVTVWVSALALIFATLVEWGSGGFSAGNRDTIAKVGNLEINRYEYERLYDNIKNFYGIPDDTEAKGLGIDDEAFREVVQSRLLELIANELSVTVMPQEILDRLMQIPAFQVNNRFNKKQYLDFLAQTGRKAEAFEMLVAKEILNEKMQNFPLFSPTNLEFNTFLTASNVADDVSIAILHKEEVLRNESFNITDSDIQEFWNKNRANYYKPARYDIAYVAIDSHLIPLHTESLKQFFNDNKNKYQEDALDRQDEALLHDYRIEQAKLYAQLSASFMDNNLKDLSDVNAKKGHVITHDADFKKLDAESLKVIQNSLYNAESIQPKSLSIQYAQIVEDNKDIYPQLLASLAKIDSNATHLKSGIIQRQIETLQDGDIFIVPYFIDKIQRVPLEFSEVKHNVMKDLLVQKKQKRFKELAQEKLTGIAHGNIGDGILMQHIGFVTLADSAFNAINNRNLGSIIPARENLKIKALQDSEIKYLVSQIFENNKSNGLVILNDNKIALYLINKQTILSPHELMNASNNVLNGIVEAKTRDMRNALFEYAFRQYKIIDYRRKD